MTKSKGFLQSNRDVFATILSELGNSNLYKHKIETCNDARPVRRPFYHNAPHTEKEINRQVDEMLKHNQTIKQRVSLSCSVSEKEVR